MPAISQLRMSTHRHDEIVRTQTKYEDTITGPPATSGSRFEIEICSAVSLLGRAVVAAEGLGRQLSEHHVVVACEAPEMPKTP